MEKYHKQDVAPIEKENERDENYEATNPQIDSERTRNNYRFTPYFGKTYTEFINGRIKELGLSPRKDAVIMNSFVLGSDKTFFDGLSRVEQYNFFSDCYKFFAERYGEENIIAAVVHNDETTPHMHLNLMPVTKDGRLCSKQLFDKPQLRQLQTDFYEAVGKRWGLQRGKEGSQKKHLSTAEFKAKKIIEQAEAVREENQVYANALTEAKSGNIPRKRGKLQEQVIALTADNVDLSKRLTKSMDETLEYARKAETLQKEKDNNSHYKILRNPNYIGHLVNFKTTRKSYKNKRFIYRDPSEWKIIENHHEAIVDKEERTLDNKSDAASIQARIDKANSRLANLIAMRADGEISKDEYQSMRSPIDKEIKELQKALEDTPTNKCCPRGLDLEGIRSTLNSLIDFSGSTISHDVINQFVYMVTPTSDTTFDWYVNLNGTADVKATFTAEGRKKSCIIKLEEIEKISSLHRKENEDNAHLIKNPIVFAFLHRQL